MSELNHAFFKKLHGQLGAFKSQIGQAIQKKRSTKNGEYKDPFCEVCGETVKVLIRAALGATTAPIHCDRCDAALKDGCAAFVTVDKRFWLGKGVKPELAGKVMTITNAQMDMIEECSREFQANEPDRP